MRVLMMARRMAPEGNHDMPNGANNTCNRPNFEAAVALMRLAAPGNAYTIEDIWMDYGAGMRWETIVCTRPGNTWGGYQVLNPHDWDLLNNACGIDDVVTITRSIINKQADLMGIKRGE